MKKHVELGVKKPRQHSAHHQIKRKRTLQSKNFVAFQTPRECEARALRRPALLFARAADDVTIYHHLCPSPSRSDSSMTQRACSFLKVFSSSTASLQSSTACASASYLKLSAEEICLAAVVPVAVAAVAAAARIWFPSRVGALGLITVFVLQAFFSGPPPP